MNNNGLYVSALAFIAVLVMAFVLMNSASKSDIQPFTGLSLLKAKTNLENTREILDSAVSDAILEYQIQSPVCGADLSSQPAQIQTFLNQAIIQINSTKKCSYQITNYSGRFVESIITVLISCTENEKNLATEFSQEFVFKKRASTNQVGADCAVQIQDADSTLIEVEKIFQP
ncbi:MAG: hypothetical protein Q7S92_02750 [Candidatus Diapherotrites archaeon]|nr:hypothetical protein [Candidatus Diapherotrites archaeon]